MVRLLPALFLLGCASAGSPSGHSPLQVEVRRAVEITMESTVAASVGGGSLVWAGARITPTWSEPPAPQERGQCERGSRSEQGRGAWAGPALTLDHGHHTVMAWSPETGTYGAEGVVDQRDLSWQPVAAWTDGSRWRLYAPGALQFGDTPLIVHTARRSDGTLSVWWEGNYEAAGVEARIATPSGTWRCGSGPHQVDVPWWLGSEVKVTIAATRTERRMHDDGTLVVGRATLVVPLEVGAVADRVLEGGWPARPTERPAARRIWRKIAGLSQPERAST